MRYTSPGLTSGPSDTDLERLGRFELVIKAEEEEDETPFMGLTLEQTRYMKRSFRILSTERT